MPSRWSCRWACRPAFCTGENHGWCPLKSCGGLTNGRSSYFNRFYPLVN
jgi:hypothetical protein